MSQKRNPNEKYMQCNPFSFAVELKKKENLLIINLQEILILIEM